MKGFFVSGILLASMASAAPAVLDEDYYFAVFTDSACTHSQFSNTDYITDTCTVIPSFVRGKYYISRYTSDAPGVLELYGDEECSQPLEVISAGNLGGCNEVSGVIASYEAF
nr:hypothetical protein CFP56_22516 [Quercus suber]